MLSNAMIRYVVSQISHRIFFQVPKLNFDSQKGDEKIALGEKYGFRINGPGKQVGCDFLVGGSSMVFNLNLAELMMSESHNLCTCEHPGYPDDIHLGECLYRLNVSVVHHKEFHQVIKFQEVKKVIPTIKNVFRSDQMITIKNGCLGKEL
jgi:hypothetical protein